MPKINILMVLDNLTIGGAQKIVCDLATNLDKNIFHVKVCTLFSGRENSPEILADYLIGHGIKVFQFNTESWRDFHTFATFKNIVKQENIHLIHAHMIPADFWGCLLGKISAKLPTIYTRHNTYYLNGFVSRFQNHVLNHGLANKIVAVSQAVKENLLQVWKAPRFTVNIIENGVDLVKYTPNNSGEKVRKEFEITPDEIVIGNISRFEARKGYDIFLKIAFEASKIMPELKFLMIGHGPQEAFLQAEIRRLGLDKVVLLSRPRMDMPEVLAAMDIFLFTPYWGEGLPCVVLEAMASGIPVVASNIGSNRELIIQDETGYLPDPKNWRMQISRLNPRAFVEKIILLATNATLRKKMGEQARRYVEQRFNLETMVQKHQALYLDLI